MDSIEKHISFRDKRDRALDLLGFGESMPLRDLPLGTDGLLVMQGMPARISIHASQVDCIYTLYHRDTDAPAFPPVPGTPMTSSAQGNGGELVLETPPVLQEIAYRIRSTRISDGRWVYLHDMAEIKVVQINPTPSLVLQVVMNNNTETTGVVRLSGGQPGVSYHLRTGVDGPDLGVAQLPEAPTINTPILAAGTTLSVLAVSGQIKQALTGVAKIETFDMDIWSSTPGMMNFSLGVVGSEVGMKYALFLDGIASGAAQTGNGNDLTFTFVMLAGQPIREASIRRGVAPSLVLEQIKRFG